MAAKGDNLTPRCREAEVAEKVRLGDLLTPYKELNRGGGVPVAAVGRYGIRLRDEIYSKQLAKDTSKNRLIFKGTLTVGMGSKQIDIGILSDNKCYAVSPAYHTYRITGVDFDYLRYCLEARNPDMSKRYMIASCRQGKTIDFDRWLDYEIPVHDERGQLLIRDALDKICELKKNAETRLEKLDLLVKSRFVEMFGDTRTNTKSLPVRRLDNVCLSIVRGPFGSALKKEFFVAKSSNTYKVYEQKHAIQKSASIGSYYIDAARFNELRRFECKPGDIIMSCSGTMGEFFRLPDDCEQGVMNQALCKFSLSDAVLPVYFLNYMKNAIGLLRTQGSGIQNIAAVSYVKSMPFLLPPLALQREFAAFVVKVDKLAVNVREAVAKMDMLYRSKLQEYFG